MRLLSLPTGARFTNKQILVFMLPVFLEQLMIIGMGIADTFMVSSIGESAVAGVSLVTSVDKFVRQVFPRWRRAGALCCRSTSERKTERRRKRRLEAVRT